MDADKKSFYEKAAKGLAASTLMYGVDSIVHVEDKDDIWFWRQILSKYRPVKYKFMPATTNEKGQRNTGCTQCLKYRGYLSRKFFVCIDSDLRYMLDEDVSAENGILQTYTYSWENHCAFARRLQETFARRTGKGDSFNFELFLKEYSRILYEPFLFMLYNERNGLRGFNRDKFRSIITLQYRQGDEFNYGDAFLSEHCPKLWRRLMTEVISIIRQRLPDIPQKDSRRIMSIFTLGDIACIIPLYPSVRSSVRAPELISNRMCIRMRLLLRNMMRYRV